MMLPTCRTYLKSPRVCRIPTGENATSTKVQGSRDTEDWGAGGEIRPQRGHRWCTLCSTDPTACQFVPTSTHVTVTEVGYCHPCIAIMYLFMFFFSREVVLDPLLYHSISRFSVVLSFILPTPLLAGRTRKSYMHFHSSLHTLVVEPTIRQHRPTLMSFLNNCQWKVSPSFFPVAIQENTFLFIVIGTFYVPPVGNYVLWY